MKDDVRPVWDIEVPMDLAEWMIDNSPDTVTRHRKLHDCDQVREWFEFVDHSSERGKTRRFKANYGAARFLEFPAPNSFVAVVGLKDHWHKLCKKRLNEMAQWDEKNKKDVAEYERLKKKFGDD